MEDNDMALDFSLKTAVSERRSSPASPDQSEVSDWCRENVVLHDEKAKISSIAAQLAGSTDLISQSCGARSFCPLDLSLSLDPLQLPLPLHPDPVPTTPLFAGPIQDFSHDSISIPGKVSLLRSPPITAGGFNQRGRQTASRGAGLNEGGTLTPLRRPSLVPEDEKDAAYWERRRKNNDAAKRSREVRRRKEDSIATRAAVLKQENLQLKAELTVLRQQQQRLQLILLKQSQGF